MPRIVSPLRATFDLLPVRLLMMATPARIEVPTNSSGSKAGFSCMYDLHNLFLGFLLVL